MNTAQNTSTKNEPTVGNMILAQSVGPPSSNRQTRSTTTQSGTYHANAGQASRGGIDFLAVALILAVSLLVIGASVVGAYLYSRVLKRKDREKKTKDGVLFEVKVPRANETEAGVAESMFANLYGIKKDGKGWKKYLKVGESISFELVGLPGEIRTYVYAPRHLAELVEKQILGSYQDASVDIVDEYNIFTEDGHVVYGTLELKESAYYPIKVLEDFTGDPTANIFATLSKMADKEGALIQLVLTPAGSGWQKAGRKFVHKVESNNSDPEKKKMDVPQEALQAISKKASKVGFRTAIRVVTSAPTEELAKMHFDNIVGAFEQYTNPGINNLTVVKPTGRAERDFMHNVIYRRMPLESKTILNVEELAALYHFPNKDITTPNINWLLSRDFPAANWINDDIDSKDTIWLGKNEYRGKVKNICFMREDRFRHSYIVAQTGVGKSWMQLRMIMQDIYNGDGVCVMDPHGSLAEMVVERIPKERIEDVIYFNAADEERPFGFNLLDFEDEQDKHRITNGFIDLLKKMYDPHNQGIVGPILERAVRNAMLTAMSEKGTTMVEVVRILTDEKWVNEKWLPLIKDDLVKRYWTDQIANTTQKDKSETLGYIVSKFDRFVTNMAIRHIIGQSKSSFSFKEVMDEGKILILNFAKGLMGEENAQFLGLLMVPKLLSAALAREKIPEDQRKDFFFHVDEFQNFATEAFTSILSEARKYKLALNVAHQYIGQLPEDIRDAIFGNVGTLIVGRVGPEDGEFLEKQFAPLITANDIINQPNIHYYTKLLVGGKYAAPFSLNPRFGPGTGFDLPKDPEVAKLVKKLSRLKYGKDVNVVREEINNRAELEVKDNKPKAPLGMPGMGGGVPPLGM